MQPTKGKAVLILAMAMRVSTTALASYFLALYIFSLLTGKSLLACQRWIELLIIFNRTSSN
jgi:hypothetical protein